MVEENRAGGSLKTFFLNRKEFNVFKGLNKANVDQNFMRRVVRDKTGQVDKEGRRGLYRTLELGTLSHES